MPGEPLVSVVVPAWNAEGTLAETLASVQAQIHTKLEIIIVDDGSTDATSAIAEEFCANDPRGRLLRQENSGVAAARNAGTAVASGAFVAPIDADDLWHPQKLQCQLARFANSPPEVGLVYNWSRIVDETGRVVAPSSCVRLEGSVLHAHLKWNFIGNGSTPMIRTSIVRELGYSPALRNAGSQGCEDYLLQLQIASRFEFACVPAFLTGYRHAGVMSGDTSHIIQSHILMYQMLLEWLPPRFRPDVERQLGRWLAAKALLKLRRFRLSHGSSVYLKALRSSPIGAATETWSRIGRSIRPVAPAGPFLGRPFYSLGMNDAPGTKKETGSVDAFDVE